MITATHKLSLSLLLAAFLASSSPVCGASGGNLRRASSQVVDIAEADVVGLSSYLLVQIDGYGLDDLAEMSPKKQAIIDCAFHKAFNEVHGDRDGLYLSGQQILATDEVREDEQEQQREEKDEDADPGQSRIDLPRRPKGYDSKGYNYDAPTRKPSPKKPSQSRRRKWNIYWYIDSSGRCNLCPDDDSMEVDSKSLLLDTTGSNQNELFARGNARSNRNKRMASDLVSSDASMGAIADAMRTNLIEGYCGSSYNDNRNGNADGGFRNVRSTDIFVLSQAEFEQSVATINASREKKPMDDAGAKPPASATDLAASPSAAASLPFYYGESSSFSSTSIVAKAADNRLFKIRLSGVGCGSWNNQDLFDVNSGLHDAINSMGFEDKGHVFDKIIEAKYPEIDRKYVWKCSYDVYAKLDVSGGGSESGSSSFALDGAALDDVGDALCADLVRYGGDNRFENVIDCRLDPLGAAEYEAVVVVAGLKTVVSVSSA